MFAEIDYLTHKELSALIHNELLAVRIKNYYSSEQCERVSELIKNYDTNDFYKVTEYMGMMKKIGKAIFDFAKCPDKVSEYYDDVENMKSILKNMFGDDNPLSHLKNEVNDLWPAGCSVEKLHNNLDMYYGLIRIFEKGSFALPHQDMTHWDMPNCPNAINIKNQFAVNVYIQVPKIGGQIVIYNRSIRQKNEYDSKKLPNSYGIDVSDLSLKEQICLKPSTGDLIISNSQMLHAVLENKDDTPRYTTSCFINYRGDHQPLRMFS